jgi:hypothetical protein
VIIDLQKYLREEEEEKRDRRLGLSLSIIGVDGEIKSLI